MVDEESDAHDAHALFEKLKGKDCVMAAHVGGRYADITFAHDEALEAAVEVHSCWGTFEWIVWDAFEKGYRVGIVGNSDGHKGRPGADFPGASFFGSQGGLTCFIAPRLDRDAIFAAMRRRHHFATTGNRMLLDVAVTCPGDATVFLDNPPGHGGRTETARRLMMGDVARVDCDAVTLDVEVVGSAPIERVDILRGREVIETLRPFAAADLGRRVRMTMEGAEYRGRARTTTWDGSLRVSGNRIERAEMFNNWNLDRGIQSMSADGVSWKAVTTGNTCGIDFMLGDAAGGELEIETKHVSAKLAVDDIGLEDTVLDGGGLERMIKFYRLPVAPDVTRITHSMEIPLLDAGDTPIFVRVTQADGHKAWSSPVYLFR
jgi:hypothetical protein